MKSYGSYRGKLDRELEHREVEPQKAHYVASVWHRELHDLDLVRPFIELM